MKRICEELEEGQGSLRLHHNSDNIAFVFFKNQIEKLMNQCPIIERRLEVLRAACVGQPREMVNLFFGLM